MPRSRGSAPARRPAAAPSRPALSAPPARGPPPQQSRPMSTTAGPGAQGQQQQQQAGSQGSGLFGQMASTAAGVAVGSSIGHAIGGFFGGGSSQPVEQQAAAAESYQSQGGPRMCEQDVNNFRQCMDQNRGDLTVCGWYLDQLKACQQAASQY